MAGGQLERVVRFLRGMAAAPEGDAPSDAHLLEGFAAGLACGLPRGRSPNGAHKHRRS